MDEKQHSEVAEASSDAKPPEDASADPSASAPPSEKNKNERKPSVHYLETEPGGRDHDGPAPSYLSTVPRFDSDTPMGHSRAPSRAETEDEYEDDDNYDWSAEEDLVDEEAKFEQKMGAKKVRKGWGPKRLLTLLFSTLLGSIFLAAILVTPPVLLIFFWYKPHPTSHRQYVVQNVSAWMFWAAANLLVSWFLGFIIDLIPSVITLAISIAWGHVSEAVKTHVEMYNSVKETVKPVFYAASGWVSWVILFSGIYKLYDQGEESNSRASYTPRVYQVIQFLFFFTLVICAQKMLSHAIAFQFHRVAYLERIDTLKEALKVVESLRNYKPKRSHYGHRSAKSTPMLSAMFGADHYFDRSRRMGTPEPFQDSPAGSDDEGSAKGKDRQNSRFGWGKKKDRKDQGKQRKDRAQRHLLRGGSPTLADSEPVSPMNHPASAESSGGRHQYPPVSTAVNTAPERIASPTLHIPSRGSPTVGGRSPAGEEEGGAVVVQAAKVLTKAVLHDARNIKGKEEGLNGLGWNVNSAHEAKRLARAIFHALKVPGRNYLVPSDFEPVFRDQETARKAFRVFDTDNNGDLSRAEIKTTLLKVYKERRLLSRSMRDVGIALKTLDQILLFFALLILFFISLSVFNVNVTSSLTSLYTLLIGASFIFRNAASNAFDAVIFLFVTHPFDTGDRCFIDDENFVVKKMGLFATVFTRADGTETYYFNSLLFQKFIINARRSGKTFENLTMQVAWRTPLEKLDELQKCMNEWLQTEENRWFEPSTSVTLQHIDYQRFLEITIGIGHNGYHLADWGMRMQRKTTFHAAVQFYCRQLGIVCYESPIPLTWANEDSVDYGLLTPGEEEQPPASPMPGSDAGAEQPEQEEKDDKDLKPSLGFLPPLQDRSHLRARKSKSKKAVVRSLGADG